MLNENKSASPVKSISGKLNADKLRFTSWKTKLFIFAVCNLIIFNVLISQNINGKLGTAGQFIIRDTNTTFLTLSQSTGNLSLNGSVTLPNTTNSLVGVIYSGANRFIHNYGTQNSFFGVNAGSFTMTGGYNTALGFSSFQSNTTGTNNTTVGHYSLAANTTGYDNTAVGFISLRYNTSGFRNTALGFQTLLNNTYGYNNTAIGYNSLLSNISGFENAAVGNWTLNTNTSGQFNTAVGNLALYYNTTGSNNTSLGYYSSFNNSTGSNNTAIGYNAIVPSGTASNQVRIGNEYVSYAGVQVPWTITSDRRWKENILLSNLGLNFISKLNPVSYVRKNNESQKTEYGFIAQEVEEVLKESGVDNSGMITIDDNGMYELRYNDFLAPMVKAIQELKTENDDLKIKNENLEERLTKYESLQNMLVNEINKLKTRETELKEIKLTEK